MIKTCPICINDFIATTKTTFCSMRCRNKSKTCPVGTERVINRNGLKLRQEIYVRVKITEGRGYRDWERKAVLLIEQKETRKLSRGERVAIKFIDGNPLNCVLSNLHLPQSRRLRICSDCGNIKVVWATSKYTIRCIRCHVVRNNKLRH